LPYAWIEFSGIQGWEASKHRDSSSETALATILGFGATPAFMYWLLL
jgi:hypothetical protein